MCQADEHKAARASCDIARPRRGDKRWGYRKTSYNNTNTQCPRNYGGYGPPELYEFSHCMYPPWLRVCCSLAFFFGGVNKKINAPHAAVLRGALICWDFSYGRSGESGIQKGIATFCSRVGNKNTIL